MPFSLRHKDEIDFLNQQANFPPRIVGLVFPILIERRVEEIVKNRWKNDQNDSVFGTLFGDG